MPVRTRQSAAAADEKESSKPQQASKEARKETPKGAPKEAHKESPKEAHKESPKEAHKESPKEAPKEAPKKAHKPQDAAKAKEPRKRARGFESDEVEAPPKRLLRSSSLAAEKQEPQEPMAQEHGSGKKGTTPAIAGMTVPDIRRAMDQLRKLARGEGQQLDVSTPLCACGDQMLSAQTFCVRFILGHHAKRRCRRTNPTR
jgi:hypothetical protein